MAQVHARVGLDDEHIKVPVAPVRAGEPIEPGMLSVELAPGRTLELNCPPIFPQYDGVSVRLPRHVAGVRCRYQSHANGACAVVAWRVQDTAERIVEANHAIMSKVPPQMAPALRLAIAQEVRCVPVPSCAVCTFCLLTAA